MVTLARAQQIFARAYAGVSGLARAVRGPPMRDDQGLVCIDGTAATASRRCSCSATCRPAILT